MCHAAPIERSRPRWRAATFTDPGRAALRKATRLALVMTGIAALGHGFVREDSFTTFASFGSFALLGFADFGGPLRGRFGLGLAFTGVGAGLVAVGTLAGEHPVASVAFVAVTVFCLSFSGVFGGYAATGSTGLIMAAVLAVMVPDGAGELPARLIGWCVAGMVGSVAMVALWPARPRPRLRLGLAEVAGDLAAALRHLGQLDRAAVTSLQARISRLRQEVDAALTRPGGPRSRDQALLYLLDELGRSTVFLDRLMVEAGERPPHLEPLDVESMAAAADVLEATAAVLAGGDDDPPTARLVALRSEEMAAVEARLDHEVARGTRDGDGGLVARFDVLFPVRMLSYLALSMATNALVAVGRPPGDTSFEFQVDTPAGARRWRDVLARGSRIARTHLRPQSRWFRNAVRAAVALAAAAAVAEVVHLDHAFWVVLGTLSVLRSSVLETGSSAFQSITGTLVGFAVTIVVMVLVGGNAAAMWVLLPVAVFAAGYVPAVVSYAAGQAAFTLMVVVLFNLVEPAGWSLGAVRVQRVALGVAISVVAAVILWPRGITHDLAQAVAAEYRAAARYVRHALDAVLVGTHPRARGRAPRRSRRTLERAHHHAQARRAVAESEFGDLMNSHGSKSAGIHTWARMVAQPHALLLGGDWLGSVATHQLAPARHTGADDRVLAATTTLERSIEEALAPYEGTARCLDADVRGDRWPGGDPGDAGPPDHLHEAREALTALLAAGPRRVGLSDRQAIGLLWSLEWLDFLRHQGAQLDEPLAVVRADVQRSWWR